ncbi:MAG: hypothetical protein K0S32_4198 [Bacteroidetes bacterium]|jgi:hypothetical protein|nr:hypothetical protein [Bacteroidota bacterium]
MTYLYVYKDSVNNLEIEEVKDITDYNSGKFKKSRAYQQFFPKNNCPDFPYAKRDYIHNILGKKLKETPLRYGLAAGNVFESNKKYETIFVSRIKKITVISGL